MFEIVFSKDARHQLRRMRTNDAKRIIEKIDLIAINPFASNPNASALKGGGFRLRIGDWRVLYEIDGTANLLQVVAVLPRGRAYR